MYIYIYIQPYGRQVNMLCILLLRSCAVWRAMGRTASNAKQACRLRLVFLHSLHDPCRIANMVASCKAVSGGVRNIQPRRKQVGLLVRQIHVVALAPATRIPI